MKPKILKNRRTTHPGTILLKEYLEPMESTQVIFFEAAEYYENQVVNLRAEFLDEAEKGLIDSLSA